jgi:hypothetical protein
MIKTRYRAPNKTYVAVDSDHPGPQGVGHTESNAKGRLRRVIEVEKASISARLSAKAWLDKMAGSR